MNLPTLAKAGNDILILLGNRIRELREDKPLTLTELGLRCGKDRQNIYKVEKGLLNVTTKNLEKIAIALEVDIKDLFDF